MRSEGMGSVLVVALIVALPLVFVTASGSENLPSAHPERGREGNLQNLPQELSSFDNAVEIAAPDNSYLLDQYYNARKCSKNDIDRLDNIDGTFSLTDLQITPQKLEISLRPREIVAREITISNNDGSKSLDVQVSTSSKLIDFSNRLVSLNPREAKKIMIFVTAPAEGSSHETLLIGTQSVDIYIRSSGPVNWPSSIGTLLPPFPPNTYVTENFVVHFDNGPGAGEDYASEEYAKAVGDNAQYCLDTEISYGFRAPPDSKIDIWIHNLGAYYAGSANVDNEGELWIELNNYWTWASVTRAMEVTVAHEVFHCIQLAYEPRGAWFEKNWIVEGTAVWMEDEVQDGVNWYLDYVNGTPTVTGLMEYPRANLEVREYDAVLYWKFLSEHQAYGGRVWRREVIRRIWEAAESENGIAAVDEGLKTISSHNSFRRSFKEWVTANWVNGLHNHNDNSQDDVYKEGDNYDDVGGEPPAGSTGITYTGTAETLQNGVIEGPWFKSWATDYREITPATDDPLKISFNGNNASDFMVRVILVKGSNVYGMNDLDLNSARDGDYWIYQADYYDNIVLIIARGENVGTGEYEVILSPEYGYRAPPFKFSDVTDDGDNPWNENYHVQLRISTNPPPGQLGGEGGSLDGGEAPLSSNENSSSQVQTIGENWVEVGRGRDHSRFWNELTGEYKQVIYSGPIHTWNGNEWVSYVSENRGNYYQIQHPIASARFYPDRTEFWDENFSERVVSSEDWSVERLENGNWCGMNFTPATISYNVIDEEEVQLVRTASSPGGTLRTTYVFRRGSPLKIMPEFTASENMSVRFAWRPEVEGAASHWITRARAKGEIKKDVVVSFFDGSAKPLVNFSWWKEAKNENVWIGVEATHENLLVHFGDFGLGTGQSAVLDPTVQIGPNADAYVNNYDPDTNYGSSPELYVGPVEGPTQKLWSFLMDFYLFDLPEEASITSSDLALYVSWLGSSGDVEAREVGIGWPEDEITWNLKPDYGAEVDQQSIGGIGYYHEWHVTSFVQDVFADSKRVSFCMKDPDEGGSAKVAFSSKEGNNAPYLEVTYTTEPPPEPPPAPTLLSPDNGSTIYTLTPRLDWEDVTGYGVDRYRIRVKKGTIPVVKDEVSSSNGNNSKYDVYENLSWGETYKWRVKAHNSVGWGNWPSWWEFTVEIPPVENAWVYWRYGSSDIDDTQYDGSMGMEGPVGATSGVWSAALPWPGPDNRWQTIYWRVKARAVGGEENWSPVYVGGVITNPPDAPLDIMALQYEPDEPYSIQLKFARPSTYGTVCARLYLCANQVGEGWGGDGFVMRVDNQTWDESITEDEFDNQEVAENENFEGKWISVGWDWVDVTNQLKAETGAHLTLRLSWRYYEEWKTGNIIDNNTLMLGTREYYDDYVTFYSTEALENWAWLEVIPPEVATSIWTSDNYGRPGENITFEITVKNNWVENDSFDLTVEDTTGWGLTLTDNLLENVAPSENRTVILSVAVPENAEPDTEDEITVTAISWADSTVSDSASCIAHAIPENTFTLDLVAGWNLVGFTAVGENDTPNNLFLGLEYYTDYYLYYWTAPGGPYKWQGPDQVLKDNLGYWVWINQDRTVKTNGARPDNREIHLKNGWNLVSFPVVNENTTPNNIFTGLEYYTDYYLYYWTAPGGPYKTQLPDQVLEDNLGYWVWINQNKTVTVP